MYHSVLPFYDVRNEGTEIPISLRGILHISCGANSKKEDKPIAP